MIRCFLLAGLLAILSSLPATAAHCYSYRSPYRSPYPYYTRPYDLIYPYYAPYYGRNPYYNRNPYYGYNPYCR